VGTHRRAMECQLPYAYTQYYLPSDIGEHTMSEF